MAYDARSSPAIGMFVYLAVLKHKKPRLFRGLVKKKNSAHKQCIQLLEELISKKFNGDAQMKLRKDMQIYFSALRILHEHDINDNKNARYCLMPKEKIIIL